MCSPRRGARRPVFHLSCSETQGEPESKKRRAEFGVVDLREVFAVEEVLVADAVVGLADRGPDDTVALAAWSGPVADLQWSRSRPEIVCQRGLPSLGPLAAGLSQDTDSHHRGVTRRQAVRAADAPLHVPSRPARPPRRRPPGRLRRSRLSRHSDECFHLKGSLYLLNLQGVNAKINRAQQCLQTLDTDIAAFCQYERRKHVFAMEQRLLPVLHSREPEPFVDYAVRAGEIAYNLRSSLDYLVWQLVEDNGEKPTCRNGFPIVFKEHQYRREAKRMLNGVKQKNVEMIQRLQPFQKDSVGLHLGMLDSICNIDKHRYLNVVNFHSIVSAPVTEDGKVKPEAIVDVFFRDEDLEKASVGYGSALEREGMNRPPVRSALSDCLTAVKVVVEWLSSGYVPDN